MHSDKSNALLLVGMVLGVLAMTFVWLADASHAKNIWKKELVRRGYAVYGPVTGEWRWKEDVPCKEDSGCSTCWRPPMGQDSLEDTQQTLQVLIDSFRRHKLNHIEDKDER